jgi:hypothetical protein
MRGELDYVLCAIVLQGGKNTMRLEQRDVETGRAVSVSVCGFIRALRKGATLASSSNQ